MGWMVWEIEEASAGVISETEEGAASPAGTISAGAPAFCAVPAVASGEGWVAPHAPSDVLITPPSIYIHFGAVVALLKNIKFIAEAE